MREINRGVPLLSKKSTFTLLKPFLKNSNKPEEMSKLCHINPDFAVGVVARRLKPKQNTKLERFSDAGTTIIMLRSKIVSQTTTREAGRFIASGG
jgi:hypothetical protein